VLTDLAPRAGMTATLLATQQKLSWTPRANGIALRIPESVLASLLRTEAYVIELAGAA